MGSFCSKNVKPKNSEFKTQRTVDDDDDEEMPPGDHFDSAFLKRMKDQFQNDMELFILNQVILSVLFYENFEK